MARVLSWGSTQTTYIISNIKIQQKGDVYNKREQVQGKGNQVIHEKTHQILTYIQLIQSNVTTVTTQKKEYKHDQQNNNILLVQKDLYVPPRVYCYLKM